MWGSASYRHRIPVLFVGLALVAAIASVVQAQTPALEVCRAEGAPGCCIECDGHLEVTNTSPNKSYRAAGYVVVQSPVCQACRSIDDGIGNQYFVDIAPDQTKWFGLALPHDCSFENQCDYQTQQLCCDNIPNDEKCIEGGSSHFCALVTGYIDVHAYKVGTGEWTYYDPPVRLVPTCHVDISPDYDCPTTYP